MNLKKVFIKNCTCSYIDHIIKIQDFDFGNILLDEKSYENLWFITFHTKIRLVQNHSVLGSIK